MREEDDEPDDCESCMGTGIGDPHADTRCSVCGGKGYVLEERDEEPDEPDLDYDNPDDDFAYDPFEYGDRKYD
jgi:hypothetical protein